MIDRGPPTLTLLRHLVRMQRAGLPWLESLDMWRDSCRSAQQKARARALIERVRAGQSLSQAMANGHWLSGAALALSEAGEASGTWGEQMGLWVSHADQQAQLARQWRSALSYPLMVLGLAMAVIAGVMVWVLPVFEGLYGALNAPLPWATQSLLQARRALLEASAPGLALLGLSALVWICWRRQPQGRWRLECWGWRIPVWGQWRQMRAESQWCGLLSSLVGAGLDWDQALGLVGPATGSAVMSVATAQVRRGVSEGQNLSQTLAAANRRYGRGCGRPLFSPTLVQWVRAGEASGTLPEVLQRWGQWQAEALAEQWRDGTRLIEPVGMGLLGVFMGWLVLALYMPVLQMGQWL